MVLEAVLPARGDRRRRADVLFRLPPEDGRFVRGLVSRHRRQRQESPCRVGPACRAEPVSVPPPATAPPGADVRVPPGRRDLLAGPATGGRWVVRQLVPGPLTQLNGRPAPAVQTT